MKILTISGEDLDNLGPMTAHHFYYLKSLINAALISNSETIWVLFDVQMGLIFNSYFFQNITYFYTELCWNFFEKIRLNIWKLVSKIKLVYEMFVSEIKLDVE